MGQMDTDIAVIGGGVAGLAATARLAADGFHVVCVDPMPADAEGPDLRTTAILEPSIRTLEHAGAWAGMAEAGADLTVMRIVDAGGRRPVVRRTADFKASDTGQRRFGVNVPNRAARRSLIRRIRESKTARLLDRRQATRLHPMSAGAVVMLDDGTEVRARLVVGADGRDSLIRREAGIAARRWDYGQRALVFAVTHDRPHGGVSTEFHRTGGPCTLVPMPDHEGAPRSAVVWMMPGARAEALADAGGEALGREITAETLGLYGPLRAVGDVASWPIISQAAHRLDGPRTVLIAEAAHVMPPIGAQGLNTSLKDVETLARTLARARARGSDIGAQGVLRRVHLARHPEMLARIAGVDVLNRFVRTTSQPLRDLRLLGLNLVHGPAPVRRLAMRLGLG